MSAMDDVNIRRVMIYIEDAFRSIRENIIKNKGPVQPQLFRGMSLALKQMKREKALQDYELNVSQTNKNFNVNVTIIPNISAKKIDLNFIIK